MFPFHCHPFFDFLANIHFHLFVACLMLCFSLALIFNLSLRSPALSCPSQLNISVNTQMQRCMLRGDDINEIRITLVEEIQETFVGDDE
jgi:hypothetical protein